MTKKPLFLTLLLVVILGLGLYIITTKTETHHILHVSYDPTRELYKDYNRIFTADYFEKTGQKLEIKTITWRDPANKPGPLLMASAPT